LTFYFCKFVGTFIIHPIAVFFIPSSYVSLIIHIKPRAKGILAIAVLLIGEQQLRAWNEYTEQIERDEYAARL
jgi:hypothetical protein